MPTLAAIAGVNDLPEQLDGEDISDIWRGAERQRERPLFWKTSSTGSAPAIRDGKWKLHLPQRKQGETELYDLSVDPSETDNVAADYPEAVKELSAKINTWVATLPAEYTKTKDKQD